MKIQPIIYLNLNVFSTKILYLINIIITYSINFLFFETIRRIKDLIIAIEEIIIII